MVSRYTDQQPLYQQPIKTDYVGRSAGRSSRSSSTSTPKRSLPTISTSKTKTGRLWVYACDNQGSQDIGSPVATYYSAPDRRVDPVNISPHSPGSGGRTAMRARTSCMMDDDRTVPFSRWGAFAHLCPEANATRTMSITIQCNAAVC